MSHLLSGVVFRRSSVTPLHPISLPHKRQAELPPPLCQTPTHPSDPCLGPRPAEAISKQTDRERLQCCVKHPMRSLVGSGRLRRHSLHRAQLHQKPCSLAGVFRNQCPMRCRRLPHKSITEAAISRVGEIWCVCRGGGFCRCTPFK